MTVVELWHSFCEFIRRVHAWFHRVDEKYHMNETH